MYAKRMNISISSIPAPLNNSIFQYEKTTIVVVFFTCLSDEGDLHIPEMDKVLE